MATIVMRSIQGESVECSWEEVILPKIKRCEKKNFASSEAFDFGVELKKKNMVMIVILSHPISATTRPELVAYLVLQHSKSTNSVLLHKLCVVMKYRRQGVAKKMLSLETEKLRQRCQRIQLWVHQSNAAAMNLYKSLSFEQVSKVDDYYGTGRTGIQMALEL